MSKFYNVQLTFKKEKTELLFHSLSAPANIRKLRSYSYRRAITTPPKIVVDRPLKEQEVVRRVLFCAFF